MCDNIESFIYYFVDSFIWNHYVEYYATPSIPKYKSLLRFHYGIYAELNEWT